MHAIDDDDEGDPALRMQFTAVVHMHLWWCDEAAGVARGEACQAKPWDCESLKFEFVRNPNLPSPTPTRLNKQHEVFYMLSIYNKIKMQKMLI